MSDIRLRTVEDHDLVFFFEHQRDPEANRMAAFTWPDPENRAAFDAHWDRVRKDVTVVIRTIECDSRVAGYVLAHHTSTVAEISYWIDPDLWGRGIASKALLVFLDEFLQRPIRARAAQDNRASLRVLEKCGFRVVGEDRGFANSRGEDTAEYLLELNPPPGDARIRPS